MIPKVTPPKLKLVEEFHSFLLKHGVIGLAVGVVIGAAVGKLVKALVDDFIMPVVGVLTPSGDWRAMKVGVGRLQFGVGDFLGNVIDFAIVAFVVFMIIKMLIKEKPAAPGPAMKICPACKESVLAEATKCKFCASDVHS
ncbi:MAG: large conductance mechanosensitive channel protein MscL [Pseudomonadota bacterium]